jgi:hypothetical protein
VRFPSATDLVMNIAGCAAGALLAARRDGRRALAGQPAPARGAVSPS